jgi:hypothetical protein
MTDRFFAVLSTKRQPAYICREKKYVHPTDGGGDRTSEPLCPPVLSTINRPPSVGKQLSISYRQWKTNSSLCTHSRILTQRMAKFWRSGGKQEMPGHHLGTTKTPPTRSTIQLLRKSTAFLITAERRKYYNQKKNCQMVLRRAYVGIRLQMKSAP